MSDPISAREALLIEAIGETANLIESARELKPVLQEIGRDIAQADAVMRDSLTALEARMVAITENAKMQTIKYLAARTQEATMRSIDQQRRAMAEAARLAVGAELSATIQRLQVAIRPLIDQQGQRWERWLTHAATATAASAVTWIVAVMVWVR